MLYELLVPLAKYHTAFNVFRYITFRTAMATVTALVISFILGPWLIRRLRQMQQGGTSVREDTPERHQKTKAGTPTMGGIGILVAILASTLLWANLRNRYVWVLVLVTAGFGLIGFMDDWKKLKTRKGISAKQKLGAQILWVGLLTASLYVWPPDGFTTGLMAKDLRTALEVARAVGGPARLAEHCVGMWNEAEQVLGYASDHTAIYQLLERSGR